MSYLTLEGFPGGLDARKFRLAAPAGTLTDAINAHITPGAEFEKRKAFVRQLNPDAGIVTSLPPGTYGLQNTTAANLVFGSGDLAAEDYPAGFAYQRLQHPAVLAGETYSAGSHLMTEVVWSEIYGGLAFVLAKFTDGRTFAYYDGVLVDDFVSGLILPYLSGDNVKLATHLKNLIDATDLYSATQVAVNVAGAANNGGGKVRLTLAVATTIPTGTSVTVAGIVGTVEANGAAFNATFVDATHIDLLAVNFVNAYVSGGTITTSLVNVDGQTGVDYTLELDPTSGLGTFTTPSLIVSPVVPVDGVEATGSFTIVGGTQIGSAATAAAGSITRSGVTPADGEYAIIGNKKYTFKTTPTTEGHVKINGSAANALTNLRAAILHAGVAGTDYICANAHPWITAGAIAGSVLPLTASAGNHGSTGYLSGNAGTGGGGVWTFTAFSAAVGNCIASVKVISLTGAVTELMGAAVNFTSTNAITAGLVAAEINSETTAGLTHGYTAEADDNRVIIYSPLAGAAALNNYRVQVTVGGNVCIGQCMFYLVQLVSPSVISSIRADGQDLVTATTTGISYPTATVVDSLDELYAIIADDINSRSGLTGFVAFASPTFVQLSKIATRSDDIDTPVYITPSGGSSPTWGVKFGTPPANPVPLTIDVPNSVVEVLDVPSIQPSPQVWRPGVGETLLGPVATRATPAGGSGLYTYTWRAAFANSDRGSFPVVDYGGQFIIAPIQSNQPSAVWSLRIPNASSIYMPATVSGLFVCEVNDGTNSVVSEAVTVQFTVG